MNLFDGIQDLLFNQTLDVFGFTASWSPSNGGAVITGRIHFRNPTTKEVLAGAEFHPSDPYMEYYEGSFPGLKAAVDAGRTEYIVVNSTSYGVKEITKKADGKTYIAKLAQ